LGWLGGREARAAQVRVASSYPSLPFPYLAVLFHSALHHYVERRQFDVKRPQRACKGCKKAIFGQISPIFAC
jgi:hypothetical protein